MMRIRPRRRKTGDDRADVLAVDFHDAHQTGGLPRLVAHGLPQPRGSRCLAPGRTAPDQSEYERCLSKVERTKSVKSGIGHGLHLMLILLPLRIPG